MRAIPAPVVFCVSVLGGGGAYIHSIYADVHEDSKQAENHRPFLRMICRAFFLVKTFLFYFREYLRTVKKARHLTL